MLPFAEHKLRHMRRYAVPNDAYKDNEYRIIIKHDPYSSIDLIDIKWEGGVFFYIGAVVSTVTPTFFDSVTNYYLLDLDRKTKRFVYTATFTDPGTGTFYNLFQSMNRYHSEYVSLNANGSVSYSHNLVENGYATRRAPIQPYNQITNTKATSNELQQTYSVDGTINLKSPYTVDLTQLVGSFENTKMLFVWYGVVTDNKLWGIARVAMPQAGNPNLGNSSGWKDNHTGAAYIVSRELDSTDLDWTVEWVIGTWTEDRLLPLQLDIIILLRYL